jgi:Mrp family chromosome partitioning ATPase
MDVAGADTHPGALKTTHVLRRGLWIILASTALVTTAAISMSLRQPDRYRDSAEVLLTYENLASALPGFQDLSRVSQEPARIAKTQTRIAMSPIVAKRVAAAQPIPGLTADEAIRAISVSPAPDSDIMSFQATWGDGPGATALASEFARQYVQYRQKLDTASLVAARKELARRIAELRASNIESPALFAKLVDQEQQLRTMEALRTANASVLRDAKDARQVQPTPQRNAVLGAVLGLMLGIALAFARDALDTRVKSAQEIGERLRLPLLGHILPRPRTLRTSNSLVMLSNRTGSEAEAFRILRTNLDFMNHDRGARSIVVTSALDREGKSTIVANLAIALMRAGRHVVLVDLDLRHPSVGRLFGIGDDAPGVTSVARGTTSLRTALRPVLGGDLDFGGSASNGKPNGAGPTNETAGEPSGSLTVLTSGPTPPDPGEFIATAGVPGMLRELAEQFEFVLVDTAALLSIGDTMALTASVDAMIVVVRLGLVKRSTLEELRRALHTCPTVKLGYVVTGAEIEERSGYGGYDEYSPANDHARTPSEEDALV